MKPRVELIDAIEGFYVALVLDGLHRSGVLRALRDGAGVGSIARRLQLDRGTLTQLLGFVSLRSTVVCAAGGTRRRFTLSPTYRESFGAHLLDQYVGAYGPCLRALPRILHRPRAGRSFVDALRHADAFRSGGSSAELLQLVEAFDVRRILDVGCGGGQLLAALARRRPDVRGIGVDANAEMVRLARRSIAAQRLDRRIRIVHSGIGRLARVVARRERMTIDAVCAVSVANEFFASDNGIDRFIGRLRKLFPARLLFLSDYYSRLGRPRAAADGFARTIVHDVAQLLSGQGLPPADLRQWQAVYARNRVTLLQSCACVDDGVRWFIHVVRL